MCICSLFNRLLRRIKIKEDNMFTSNARIIKVIGEALQAANNGKVNFYCRSEMIDITRLSDIPNTKEIYEELYRVERKLDALLNHLKLNVREGIIIEKKES